LKRKLIERIAETHYVRSVIRDRADLSAFKKRPSFRELLGISAIGISYIICWPAITALGALSVYLNEPLWVAIGGPLSYGLSHLVFLAGMYLAGAEYSKIFLRWATRLAIEKLMSKRP
jgi:hypothetical protein